MKKIYSRELNLQQIADSGQCFRWNQIDENTYRIVALGRVLIARQDPETMEVTLDCSEEEYDTIWSGYLDMGTDYAAIIDQIPDDDTYLRLAANECCGIRILRQDPWESLISFIISQRKNIPAIKASVEKLCKAAGHRIKDSRGEIAYSFPTPEELAALSLEQLERCSLGYRAPYIYKAAHAVADGTIVMEELERLDDDALFERLLSLYGVGIKVANCTRLFGFHRMDSFPIDVWMNRIQERHYPEGFPVESYRPWGGVMQQYMFAYERSLEN